MTADWSCQLGLNNAAVNNLLANWHSGLIRKIISFLSHEQIRWELYQLLCAVEGAIVDVTYGWVWMRMDTII